MYSVGYVSRLRRFPKLKIKMKNYRAVAPVGIIGHSERRDSDTLNDGLGRAKRQRRLPYIARQGDYHTDVWYVSCVDEMVRPRGVFY